MLTRLLADALNHVLRQNDWARKRLAAHAGALLRLNATPWQADFRVSPLGFLLTAPAVRGEHVAPELTLSLPLAALPKSVGSATPLSAQAELAGRAEIAETFSLLLRELRWDPEDDLAAWLGDLGAQRLGRLASGLFGHWREGTARLHAALREFVHHEAQASVTQANASARQAELAALGHDLQTLIRRVDRLASRRS